MRLFKNFEPGADQVQSSQRKSHSKKSKETREPKESLSASDIKRKVQEHFTPKVEQDKVEVSNFSKIKNQTKKEKEIEDSEVKVPSDVGLNNPNDPATVGKLKDVLSKGAFSFDPKEREALEKILGERA